VTRHRYFLSFILLLLGFLGVELFGTGAFQPSQQSAAETELASLVKRLQLTDFALWSEARYARHPSQADWFTPHQDFPGSLEHFPAGSLIAPAPVHPTTRLEVRHQKPPGAG
jgi:hypothetical protein